MVYDKYRDWPLPGSPSIQVAPRLKVEKIKTLEEQVLEDLGQAGDEMEKLEILDSYAAYKQRVYRQEFAESSSSLIGQQLGNILYPVFLQRLPEPFVFHRGRVGRASEG